MNVKQRPNHKKYIETLRKMSSQRRLIRCFELSEFTKELFLHGLHKRFPELPEQEIKKIYMERIKKCHNRVY